VTPPLYHWTLSLTPQPERETSYQIKETSLLVKILLLSAPNLSYQIMAYRERKVTKLRRNEIPMMMFFTASFL